jgi:RNA polymerase sigma-70 factor (ECF subfamily)
MHFDRLVARHKDAVYRQMVRMCGNQDDAEDVLAESLLKAWRAMGTLDDEANFQAWLAIIARRTCGRLRQRDALTPVLHLADLAEIGIEPVSPGKSPDQAAIEAHTKQCLLRVLDSLAPMYRDVYELRDIQGLTAEETSEKLGVTVAAVKSRLHRARAMVRERTDQSLLG